MNSVNGEKVSSFWDENVKLHEKPSVPLSWLDAPIVMEHCLKKLTAGEKRISAIQWLLWVKEKLVPSVVLDYGLSLGCGDGTLERQALSMNICARFDAFDISGKSIGLAKTQAEEKGLSGLINYQVADLNTINLECNKYDIVFCGMALHHVQNLEHLFEELKKGLKPNGRFILTEFVGPSQFQWTDKQLGIIREILGLLPIRLKIDARSGTVKEYCVRPTVESMNELDPSEAIRSSDILPLVYKMWEVEERIDFGGTILHMLLDGIVANFDAAREEDVAILKLLEYFEDTLIKENVLPSDFTLIVARRPSGGTSIIEEERTLFRKFVLSLKENGYRHTTRKVFSYLRKHYF